AGAVPLLVDIDPQTYTLSTNILVEAIGFFRQNFRGTIRAVVPVHLYGLPVDMPGICAVAHKEKMLVIEDCAQSHGASIGNCKTGAWGDLAAFSFYPTKNLGALGDGGAVVTSNAEFAEKARSLREYGWKERYISESVGINSRLDPIQAAILSVKLR